MIPDKAILNEIKSFQDSQNLGKMLSKKNLTSFELDEIMGES
ncbi:MAG: hypothetical protein V3V78_00330 [Candidatus Woesearchaeota archaeon]